MIIIPTTWFWILIATFMTLAICTFLLGWNLAVGRFKSRYRRIETHIADLEQQAKAFTEAIHADATRAAIDAGKRYATNQMQNTIDALWQEIP